MPGTVEMVAADASNAAQMKAAAAGASVLYQAMNPPYHQWHTFFPQLQSAAIAAAKNTNARYVSIENLYMYDSSKPMTEDSQIAPRSKKGILRARMADELSDLQKRGELQLSTLRSSDYYGPGVVGSALGDMVFGNLVRGKKAQIGGSATLLHSFAYIEDVGRAAAMLGTRDEALGKVWIAPHAQPISQGEMVEKACRGLGMQPNFTVISPTMMRMAGLFVPGARAMVEMMYEFTEPFTVDSSRFRSTFGLEATPIDIAIGRTMEWFKQQVG
jgi:nucleoside-diphosphate-sugar epimerase